MDEDFEKWVAQWAAAEQEIAKERPAPPEPEPEPVRTSFFSDTPAEHDYEDGEGGSDDWHSIYSRAMEIDFSQPDTLITDATNVAYMGSEGYGKEIPKGTPPAAGGKKVYTNNPVHFSSVGTDQEDDEGRVRVTKNWTDGDELLELDDIKKRVEEMERKVHDADVLKKPGYAGLKTQLEGLRKRVKSLSEKIMSTPQGDLT